MLDMRRIDWKFAESKRKMTRTASPESEAMASARREYRAMLETTAAKGKGGRPKKQAAQPKAADDLQDADIDEG